MCGAMARLGSRRHRGSQGRRMHYVLGGRSGWGWQLVRDSTWNGVIDVGVLHNLGLMS
jgi:hypothetical protein